MKPLTVQSNGMGQQSVALYLMASTGVLPRFDYSIFCDPGAELPETYEYLEWLKDWAKKNNGIPIIHVDGMDIVKDLNNGRNSTGQTFASIPAFTESSKSTKYVVGQRGYGMLRRQCTNEYKIEPLKRQLRKIYGLGPRKWFPVGTSILIGITLEEVGRIGQPDNNQIVHHFPFVNILTYKSEKNCIGQYNQFLDHMFTRSDCVNWLRTNGFPIPPKSACFFCPFMTNRQWKQVKQNPKIWPRAVELDRSIRDSSKMGVDEKIYLHRQLVPLPEVDLSENQTDLTECEGFCHI